MPAPSCDFTHARAAGGQNLMAPHGLEFSMNGAMFNVTSPSETDYAKTDCKTVVNPGCMHPGGAGIVCEAFGRRPLGRTPGAGRQAACGAAGKGGQAAPGAACSAAARGAATLCRTGAGAGAATPGQFAGRNVRRRIAGPGSGLRARLQPCTGRGRAGSGAAGGCKTGSGKTGERKTGGAEAATGRGSGREHSGRHFCGPWRDAGRPSGALRVRQLVGILNSPALGRPGCKHRHIGEKYATQCHLLLLRRSRHASVRMRHPHR